MTQVSYEGYTSACVVLTGNACLWLHHCISNASPFDYFCRYVRAEVLAGFVNGLFLIFTAFFIFSEGVEVRTIVRLQLIHLPSATDPVKSVYEWCHLIFPPEGAGTAWCAPWTLAPGVHSRAVGESCRNIRFSAWRTWTFTRWWRLASCNY